MHETHPRHLGDDSYPTSSESLNNRSLASLIKEIRDESTTLFRQEVALARTEISEKLSRLSRSAAMLAAGLVLTLAGVIALVWAAGEGVTVALIAAGLEDHARWLGPLIVGLIVAVLGGAMVANGKESLQSESIVPEKTAQSLQENKEWVRHKVTT